MVLNVPIRGLDGRRCIAPPQAAKLGRLIKNPFGSHLKSSDNWEELPSGEKDIDRADICGMFNIEALREKEATRHRRGSKSRDMIFGIGLQIR